MQNPLQAALSASRPVAWDQAEAGPSGAADGGGGRRGRARPVPRVRSWAWYDEVDEREEQKRERRRSYGDRGHAYLLNVPQSMKKCHRVLRLVRAWGRAGGQVHHHQGSGTAATVVAMPGRHHAKALMCMCLEVARCSDAAWRYVVVDACRGGRQGVLGTLCDIGVACRRQ